jgi:hypothetical protein
MIRLMYIFDIYYHKKRFLLKIKKQKNKVKVENIVYNKE